MSMITPKNTMGVSKNIIYNSCSTSSRRIPPLSLQCTQQRSRSFANTHGIFNMPNMNTLTSHSIHVNGLHDYHYGNHYYYTQRSLFSSTALSATKTNNQEESHKKNKAPIKNIKKSQSKKNDIDTGGLRRLPVVKSPIELINRAIKTTKRDCRADSTIKNARNRARKHATITLDTLTKELCVPLRDVVNGYKHEISNLHSFEKVVADLTVKARQKRDGVSLLLLLNDIHECRKEILACGKDWVAKAKYAETAKEAMDCMVQGEKALVELFNGLVSDRLTLLINLQKSLRTTPAVRLDTPAVVLVGAPNVGKSSIVRAISSATPEVNNYPFTTRGMTLGHGKSCIHYYTCKKSLMNIDSTLPLHFLY